MGRAVAPCHHLRVDSGQKQQGRQQASLLVVLRVGVMPMPILIDAGAGDGSGSGCDPDLDKTAGST